MSIPRTFSLPALADAYRRAQVSWAYYLELRAKGDDESRDEARCLLYGWGEVWNLLDEIGLNVTGDYWLRDEDGDD
ncbi:hypothetical protein AB0B97_29820 [Micromonospora sp. NPDC049004]|uniref:hypothetical protein n=1 Tax=Micromonospora sp. NPDC049004 TaxID=3154348 RepID=UPI00340C1781